MAKKTFELDYYGLLGVKHTYAESTIRKAYRALVKALEAEVGQDYIGSEQFKNYDEALTVLSDPDERARYDDFWKKNYAGAAAEAEAKQTTVHRPARSSR